MANEIVDCSKSLIISSVLSITQQHIKVVMSGENGFKDVTTGSSRKGKAVVNNNVYNIQIPGLKSGGKFEVEFKRV